MKPLTMLTILLLFAYGAFAQANAVKDTDGNSYTVKKMPDGKVWMTENLKIKITGSYCYDNSDANCEQYGRLYTWRVAQAVCRLLGNGWRLPSNEDWQLLGKQFGGVRGDSSDGKAAYAALKMGGSSGFNFQEAGGRTVDSIPKYTSIDAHGFYWTSTSVDDNYAWMYNFGDGAQIMNRHSDLEKRWALAVRCVKD
jgi:uncharacterized protein (TIGR02145 family)